MSDADPPLSGLRVLTSTADLPGAFATYLLAGLGADVVRAPIARPGPDECARETLARGGRHVTAADATSWDALARRADAVLTDEGGLPHAVPATTIACHLTTWGTPDDPRPADEALVHAATGIAACQRSWTGDPVWLVTPMAGYMTGMLAALGITAAHWARLRGGPAQTIATSRVHGAIACNSGTYVSGPDAQGRLTAHGTPRGPYPSYGLYATADGWLLVAALTPAFWVNLLTATDRLDLLTDPDLAETPMAFTLRDYAVVREALEPVFRTETTATWVARLREADVPCGPVRSRADLAHDDEAIALGLVVDGEAAGPAAAFSATPGTPIAKSIPITTPTEAVLTSWPERPSPDGPARTTSGCLAGIRVLDLTSFIAGPVCPVLLADLGADVVKIESASGDPFRLAVYGFVGWNRGKRSLVLDLKTPDGREALLDLAARADVVVDNFRPGVMTRLGLGTPALQAANPRLIHTVVTGFGPHVTLPGFDPVFQARSGIMVAQGGDDEPVFHNIAYNDYAAGTLAALATVAALVARERTGRGQRVDVSLFRASIVAQAAELGAPRPGGRDFAGPSPGRRLVRVADGWICVAMAPDTSIPHDLAAGCVALTRAEAVAHLTTRGIPATSVVTYDELFDDAALAAVHAVVTVPDRRLGPLTQCGPVLQMSATPIPDPRPAPDLGADGAAVLAEAGFTPERIARLLTPTIP